MNKLVASVAAIVALFVLAFGDAGRVIGSGPDQFGGYTTEHVLVRFNNGQVPTLGAASIGSTGVRSLDLLGARWRVTSIEPISPEGFANAESASRLGISRTYKFVVPRGTDVLRMVDDYNRNALIEFAEVDGIGGTAYIPNDPLIHNCYGLNNTGQTGGTSDADIDAYEAWDTWKGGDNIVLAVVDSGVSTHPELTSKLVPGWNTNSNSSNTSDGLGHGTHVAGTAGA